MDKNTLAVKTYNKIARAYAKEFFEDDIDIKYLDKFLSLLPNRGKILDVGCGPGMDTKYFFEKGYFVEGIDLSKEMINIAKKMVPQGKFRVMDMRKLKYKDESFDGLCVTYSLCHIESKQVLAILRKFWRVLKSQGILLLLLQEGKGEEVIPEPFDPNQKMFFKYYQKDEIKNLLQKTKFEIIYISTRKSRGALELRQNKLFIIARKHD